MRVIQLVDVYGIAGGLERFVYNLCTRLAESGHEPIVVAFEASVDPGWGEPSYPVVCLSNKKNGWNEVVRDLRPDLVIWHATPRMTPVALELCTEFRTVGVVHGVLCPSGSRLYRDKDEICTLKSSVGCLSNWYRRQCGFGRSPITAVRALHTHSRMMEAINRCDRIYAVSQTVKEFLVLEGVSQPMITVFDNTLGRLWQARSTGIESRACVGGDVRVLFVGRLVYAKGVQYLLRAIKELLDQGTSVKCDIVGDGWYRGQLVSLAKSLGISDVVLFHGRVPGTKVSDLYTLSDVVVVPSIWPEPAGLVVPEAREHGKPVVVFDSGGLSEWAWYMDAVYSIPRADIKRLSQTILDCVYMQPISQGGASYVASSEKRSRADLINDLTR